MLADDELRSALSTRFPEPRPDIEGELDRLLVSARSRARRRRSAYVAVVVAAVVATIVALGHDWQPEAGDPQPVDQFPAAAAPLLNRGTYMEPEALAPGRYRAYFLGPSDVTVELDIPVGWGQDDIYAFATGPGQAPRTRRIDLFDEVAEVRRDPCSKKVDDVAPGARDLVGKLATLARTTSTGPTPVTVDGYPGYFVRLEDAGSGDGSNRCTTGTVPRESGLGGLVYGQRLAGWTSQIWVVDVADTTVVISATYGPDVTSSQEAELVRIVESASFVLP